VKNGVLHLVAERQPTVGRNQEGTTMKYACRSGIITTYPGFRFKYGYIQITARIPYGTGLWPAFWLAAANQQWPPEIDILEHWESDPVAKVFLHPKQGPVQGGAFKTPNLSKGWHNLTLYWTKSRLTWYSDGRQALTTSTGIPQQAMYFIANLAVFNARPGGCSGSVLIKSVKVWQPIGAEAST
jgi:beta-glucanase (GH16 family)